MYETTTLTRSAFKRLTLWLMAVALFASLPSAAHARPSLTATCSVRHNRADFDGDCKTDISTFNRSTGEWKSLNSSSPNGTQIVSVMWGQSGDIPTPGDYDGDGKTDRAVFRPGIGTWFIATAIDPVTGVVTASRAQQFGTSGDIPVARDYDGDNKTDIAVFRPGTATWYILNSSNNSVRYEQFGLTGDRVVPGDYDGDGKEDVAVFRPDTRYWWILRSSDATHYSFQWGETSDWPVQADYDGDGKTDIAVFRPGTGTWWIVKSSSFNTSHYAYTWGVSGDRPVPGDYDGDSKADVAVQRPTSNGGWHIILSSTGAYNPVPFVAPEFPVPGAYLTPLY